MTDHSQNWHDGLNSRKVSNGSSDGIAAVTNKLDSLGRDTKKLKKNVYDIQVGCETCGGAHLDKECPLHEEVKSSSMTDHSQNWRDELNSRKVSNGSSDGITAVMNKLDSLGRDTKKLKKNVHDIQVGCETCGGAHLDKECPLHKEVKSVEEVKIRECKAIFTKNGLSLYTPFYYSREEIEYISANLSFSEEKTHEEIEKVMEIEETTAHREPATHKVTTSEEALVHKTMESLKRIKVKRSLLKVIRQMDDYAKHIMNLVVNKPRTSGNEDVMMNPRCSVILQN
ncbi:hypothetical protein Tco_1446024 [Tanacetum coccineum]